MRAVVITEPGGPEVVSVADLPVREPGEGEVRIAVRAAAVSPTDSVLRQRGAEDLPAPWVPGMDAAGIVESGGPGRGRPRDGHDRAAPVRGRRPGRAAGRPRGLGRRDP